MIHYHGLPITPEVAALEVLQGGHAFVSFAHQMQLGIALNVCQSFALDNGAFSAWTSGKPVVDWDPFYKWVDSLSRHPGLDFVVIPDVIGGDEDDNDWLLEQWPFSKFLGAPVWHMHETFDRLIRLCNEWPRVCIGSSGEFATVGTEQWWVRMSDAMGAVCDRYGRPMCKLHGLRMLNPKVFSKLPLSSADSTNIGRNVNIDSRWKSGAYLPPTKAARARLMRWRIEHFNSPSEWAFDL